MDRLRDAQKTLQHNKEQNLKIKSLPEEERPVEKTLTYGAAALSNSELLAVLLGSGTREKSAIGLAEEILVGEPGGLHKLADLTVEDLTELSGVGPFKAARVVCAVELGKRLAAMPRTRRASVTNADEAAAFFMEGMRHEKREIFRMLLLNVKGEVISLETVSVGELSSTPVHPREVFGPAVRKSAASVIVAHNHPSGDPHPSDEDRLITDRLIEAGEIMGIRVLDHLIIGDGIYESVISGR